MVLVWEFVSFVPIAMFRYCISKRKIKKGVEEIELPEKSYNSIADKTNLEMSQ
jgi:hypothetical protein